MKKSILVLLACFTFLTLTSESCQTTAESSSGVKKATAKVSIDLSGLTVEQKNIMEKNSRDSKLGVIRYLYIISAYTGDVIEYSTVKGKITSGGKRLNPKTTTGNANTTGFIFDTINGNNFYTNEVLNEDGSYGESASYYYWFDANDNYHQIYPTGGTYTHVSDKPLTPTKTTFTFK